MLKLHFIPVRFRAGIFFFEKYCKIFPKVNLTDGVFLMWHISFFSISLLDTKKITNIIK